MKKILVPMDFSEEAVNALEVAVGIARKGNAEIILSHIIEIPGYFYKPMDEFKGADNEKLYANQLIEYFTEEMNEIRANNQFHDVEIKSQVEVGSTYPSLDKIIRQNKVDLVVMGARGVSGEERLLLGSTTQRMIRHADCPVLIIKGHVNVGHLKKIVLATNCTQTPHYLTNEIKDLVEILGAKLHLLMVNVKNEWESHRDIEVKLKDFAILHNLEDYEVEIYNDSTALEGIIHYSEDQHAGVIALMTHGITNLSNLISESISEKVASHSTLPVWTCGFKNVHYKK